MPAKFETMKVRLNNNNQWEMKQGKGPWQGPPNYPEIEVNKGDVGVFTYEIVGSGTVTFDPLDPFVQKANANPQQPDFGDQFRVFGKGERELTIIDVNGQDGTTDYPGGNYAYELRFSEGAPPLDPIIKNLGCCKAVELSSGEAVVYALTIAAGGALAAIGVRKLFSNRAPASVAAAGRG